MEDAKELIYPSEVCPHCGNNILKFASEPGNSKVVDVENVDDQKYGVQARWKEVYTCPYCGKKFYLVCEH